LSDLPAAGQYRSKLDGFDAIGVAAPDGQAEIRREEGSVNSLVGQSREALDTPALMVDLDILQRNIDRMAATIVRDAKVGWRPHTKAMKTPALANLCLEAGAHGITCAKLGEAEVMAAAGIHDILVANQIVGPAKIDRLVNVCRRADVMVCVDQFENAESIDRAAGVKGVRPRVLIEVDVGMQRAGVLPGEPTVDLARRIAQLRHVRFAGLQTWEAQVLGESDLGKRKLLVEEALGKLTDTAEAIRNAGIPVEIVSCGGTGTYWISAFVPGITEIEAGGGVYCDITYRHDYGVEHEFALTILSTVTSRPHPARIICDAGFKTMSRASSAPKVLGGIAAREFVMSAEHGIIRLAEPSESPRVGDKIEIIPGYSDSTVFLHDVLYGIRDGRVETVWPLVGRGKLA
jgi:D-serine deaminase-like pyridoxal phosphate-dependent protein